MKKKKFGAVFCLLAAVILLICPPRALAISPTVWGFPGASYWREEDQFAWARAMESAMDAVQGGGAGSGAGSGLGTGEIFYVDYNVSNAGDGSSWLNAVATLDEVFALCEHDRGDVVHVAELHAEDWTTTDSADCDVRGVAIIGHGEGSLRPTFTFDDTDGEFVLGAANCYVYNLAFQPSIDQVVHAIEVEDDADGSVIDSCWFMDGETAGDDEFIDAVQFTTASDNITIVNCKFESYSAAGANTGIDLTAGVVKDVVIAGNYFNGNYAEAPVYSDDIDLRMLISWNDVTNSASNQFGIEFTANATGICEYNVCNTSTNYEIDEGVMITHGNNSDATDLGAANLDHLMLTAVANGDNMETEVVDGTVLSNILTKTGDTSDYTRATMSIEYLAETVAAILVDTAAADTSTELRTLLYGSDTAGGTGANQTSILTVLRNGTPATITTPGTNLTILDILGGNGTTTTGASAASVLGAIGTNEAAADTPFSSSTVESDADGSVLEREEWLQVEMAKIPKSDSTVSWNATALGAIEAEVDDSMETYKLDHLVQAADSDDPADDSIIAKMASKTGDWSTFSASTDSFEAIRDFLEAMSGVGFRGTCSSNAVTTTVICSELTLFGDDYFNTGWSLTVLKNASAPGTLCENQTIDIIDYDSATGTFTLNVAAAEAITASDEIYVRRIEELNLDTPTILGGSGNIWYVDAGTGATGDGSGYTWENAFATITLALDAITESNGDVIYAAAGHAETIAASYAIDDAGVEIIGMGDGPTRPTLSFSATGSVLAHTVANVKWKNFIFVSTTADTTVGITLDGSSDGAVFEDCLFTNTTTSEFADMVTLADGTDDVRFTRCQFINNTAVGACVSAITNTSGVCDSMVIEDCYFYGTFSTAALEGDQADTNVRIVNNTIHNASTGDYAVKWTSNTSFGEFTNNKMYADTVATIGDIGGLKPFGNMATDAIDEGGIAWPSSSDSTVITSTRDGSVLERLEFICKYLETGTPGALVAPASTYSLLDILGSDGSTTTGAVAGSLLGAIGTNEAASATAFTSASAEADADGSLLERAEYLQNKSDDVLAALGIDATTASVFYVDSVSASGGGGTSWADSANTLALGVTAATTNTGAIIFVAPDHAEAAITTSQAINKADITIIGMGNSDSMPTFTMSGANGAMTHTVADVTWQNCMFISGTIDTTVCHSLDGASDGATFIDCVWKGTTGGFGFLSTVTLASGCDDVVFRGCKFNNASSGDTDATAAITNTDGVTDGMIIEDCDFYGAWTTAAISSDDIDTDVVIQRNNIQNSSAGAYAVKFTAAALGTLADNYMYTNAYATMLDPGSLKPFNNWGAISADEAAMQMPISTDSSAVTATRDGSNLERLEEIIKFLETGTLDKLTAPADTYSILDILGTDGATTTGAVAGSILGAIGTNEAVGDTPFSSSTVGADRDGSVLERLEEIIKFFETGTLDKLTAPADTYSILDILGTDGATTTGAVAGSLLGAIGTNEAASATAFTSSAAEADADGSLLERLEYLQAQTEDAMVKLGIDTTTADVWYVDSVSASGGDGTSWAQSENTLKLAVDDATDSVGAYIFVAPGHVEATITASQAIDCPGITIVGLGNSDLRPTFTMSGANGAMTHTVADVTWINCMFISGTIDTTVCHSLDGSSDGATFIDCVWKGTTGGFGFDSTVTLASGCDDVVFRNCKFNNASSGDTDATAAITNTDGVTDGMVVEDCDFYGAWTTAAISSDDIDTDVVIQRNNIQNSSAGAYAVKFTAAALGTLADNYMYTNAYATMLDPGSLKPFNNWGAISADEAAMQIPISSDSTAVTAVADGSIYERLEAIQNAAASIPAYNGTNYVAVTVEFDGTTGAAHWGKAGETDEVLTVTGAVHIKMLIECTDTCTGTDGGTIALWGGTDVLIAATVINTEGADGTNLDVGELWLDTSPIERVATASTAFHEFVAIDDDIGLDCQVQDIADGTVVFHVWWAPLNATGAVAAGAGGTL